MDPGRQLKWLRAFLLFSFLVCIPAFAYFVYVGAEARIFRLAIEQSTAAAISTSEQYVAITREVKKEYDILEAMLANPANRDNPDLGDFVEGRREHLAEIQALLKNAWENLDEGRIAIRNTEAFDYDTLVYAEICFEVAHKKLKEAGEELHSYQKMI